MRSAAARASRLLHLVAAIVLVGTVLAPAPGEAARTFETPLTTTRQPRLAAATFRNPPQHDQAEPQNRFRLFEDLSLPPRVLELVQASKTASGVFDLGLGCNVWQTGGLFQNCGSPSFQGLWTDPSTGLSYARNRWYDSRTASWLSEDPLGAVDSPNVYAFVGWGPHMGTDPMGLHTFRKVVVDGVEYTALAPDADEIAQGDYSISISYTPTGKTKPVALALSQHEGEMVALQARLGNPLLARAFETFYGTSVDSIPDSILELEGKGVWHHKVDIAVAALAGFVMAGGRPQVPSEPGGAPKVNLLNPRPSTPISEIPEAWQNGQRVYKIPPGAAGGDTAYSRVSPEVRQRFFPDGELKPLCSYCRARTANPVDHVDPKSGGGNLNPENTTPSCTHCNPSKGARPAPKSPPPEYTGDWPPEWWPERMKTWWKETYGG